MVEALKTLLEEVHTYETLESSFVLVLSEFRLYPRQVI